MLSAITLNEVPGSNPCFHNTRRGPAHDDIEDARRTFFEAVRGGDDYLLRSVVACFWRIAAMAYRLGQAIVVTTRRGIGGNIFLATTSAAPFFFVHRVFRGASGRSAGRGARNLSGPPSSPRRRPS